MTQQTFRELDLYKKPARNVRRAMRTAGSEGGVRSHFMSRVHDRHGNLKFISQQKPNLTTDTASGYTNRRAWQAKAISLADVSSTYSGAATSTTATALNNTGVTFPTAGHGLAGRFVVADTGAAMVFGGILSNTGTQLV